MTPSGGHAGTSTVFYGETIVLRSDGSFDYVFAGMSHGRVVRENDAGTFTVSGDRLVLHGRTRGVTRYQVVGLEQSGNATTMVLLAEAYPATQPNIDFYGERWIRGAR